LSNLGAAAIVTAELHDALRRSRDAADRAEQRSAFLAEASATLAGSLEYEQTLRTVAALAVPHIADWCAVDVLNDADEIERLAVAHTDPAKIELARQLQQRYPDRLDRPGGVGQVLRTGVPALYAEITDEMVAAGARDEEHRRALLALTIRSVMIVPLSAHGRTLGAISFVQAESGRRYGQADLAFAQEVAARAALAVDNARTYRQLAAANRAKDEFLATLSHELRTPLNAVLGWVRMLRVGAVTGAKAARALEVIERNADAQLELVEDLLDVSRIITGKLRLDIARVDLEAIVRAAVETIQPAAAAKRLTLEVQLDEAAGPLVADAARLQQAVWNLLSNAIRFTPAGGAVAVRVARTESEVAIEVRDTGEGSRRRCCRTCSTASARPTAARRARTLVLDSASPSSATSSSCTVAERR
jgi:signal transduction histidine kinase